MERVRQRRMRRLASIAPYVVHPAVAGPACVVVGPTRAIHFGDVLDPDAKVHRLVHAREHQVLSEGSNARPQIFYLTP
jgi:Fe-S-cluster-containing dehydrogenase component